MEPTDNLDKSTWLAHPFRLNEIHQSIKRIEISFVIVLVSVMVHIVVIMVLLVIIMDQIIIKGPLSSSVPSQLPS
jgi:hypothetical protein